jgi:DNA-binding response OmpR family regulator
VAKNFNDKELRLYAKGKSVLVVDDDDMTRKIIEAILSEYFDTIDMASNGTDALEKYRSNEYDIVLTDIYMPTSDGVTLIKKIRRENHSQPIIVISATEDIDQVVALIDNHIDSFIRKPLDINVIKHKINNVLENIFYNKILKDYQSDKTIKTYLQSQGISCSTVENSTCQNYDVSTAKVDKRLSATDFIAGVTQKDLNIDDIVDELEIILENLEDTISYILVNGANDESIESLSKTFSKLYNIVSVFDELSDLSDILYEIHDFLVEFDKLEVDADSTRELFTYSQYIVDDMRRFIHGVFIDKDSDNIYIYKDLFESVLNQLHIKVGKKPIIEHNEEDDDITFF